MARILITGGAGFIGSHLCERFLAEGDDVICMDNFLTGAPDNVAHLFADRRFSFIQQDVTTYIYVKGPLDAILHFASPASPVDYLELPIQTLKVGSLGTHKALGLAKEKSARFLLASTSEVYGDPLVHPQKEDYWGHVNPIGPRGVYDEAKRFAEALTMAYHRTHGVETRIVRIFNTHGPRMRLNDGRVVPNFISQALRGEPLTVYGDGSRSRTGSGGRSTSSAPSCARHEDPGDGRSGLHRLARGGRLRRGRPRGDRGRRPLHRPPREPEPQGPLPAARHHRPRARRADPRRAPR